MMYLIIVQEKNGLKEKKSFVYRPKIAVLSEYDIPFLCLMPINQNSVSDCGCDVLILMLGRGHVLLPIKFHILYPLYLPQPQGIGIY